MNYLKIITPPIFCVIIIVFTKMSIYYYPLSFGFIIGLFNWKKHKHNPYFGTILSLIVSNVSFWLAFLCIGIFSEFREWSVLAVPNLCADELARPGQTCYYTCNHDPICLTDVIATSETTIETNTGNLNFRQPNDGTWYRFTLTTFKQLQLYFLEDNNDNDRTDIIPHCAVEDSHIISKVQNNENVTCLSCLDFCYKVWPAIFTIHQHSLGSGLAIAAENLRLDEDNENNYFLAIYRSNSNPATRLNYR